MPHQEPAADQLHVMRHSLAHIMASAIQELYPAAKFGVGPVIENGFYYDVDLMHPLSTDDLAKIENAMEGIIKADLPFERQELPLGDALKHFKDAGQLYKVELLNDLKNHGTTVAKDIDREQLGVEAQSGKAAEVTTVSLYKHGKFTDLCRGPHLESTGQAGTFKLTKVSGAYWRGKAENPQMQRVYGVAFATVEDLKAYLKNMEEAEKRDHRKLGKELDLFTFSDLVGPGLPLYTPRGTVIKTQLQNALTEVSSRYGMLQVSIPHLAKIELYEASGHAQKFEGELFRVASHYKQEFVLKPVNCPHHTQIYASRPRSYRDLPLRYMESTMQYRDEKPGQIGGLTRTRGFTVDDGHIFCRVDQIKNEAEAICKIIEEFYTHLGMYGSHWVSLSVRDPASPDSYIGEPKDWDQAEQMLAQISDDMELGAKRMEGEAAIYGPKLDFMFKDAIGNERQLATIQIDFAMPKRFGLTYVDADGEDRHPVIIHRAILGSYERFMAILIEHYAGAFPVWLSPEQVRLATVSDNPQVQERAEDMMRQLMAAGVRTVLDNSNESVGKKIREATLMKVPYIIVVGEKEVAGSQVSPRVRTDLADGQPAALEFADLVKAVSKENLSRTAKSTLKG